VRHEPRAGRIRARSRLPVASCEADATDMADESARLAEYERAMSAGLKRRAAVRAREARRLTTEIETAGTQAAASVRSPGQTGVTAPGARTRLQGA
jgi:hypothetical protein